MTTSFSAIVVRENQDPKLPPTVAIETLTDSDLPDGDVVVDVEYSSLNYKDGMALTGQGRIALLPHGSRHRPRWHRRLIAVDAFHSR